MVRNIAGILKSTTYFPILCVVPVPGMLRLKSAATYRHYTGPSTVLHLSAPTARPDSVKIRAHLDVP